VLEKFMMCLGATWFVVAFHSTPMRDPGLEEFQRPELGLAFQTPSGLKMPKLKLKLKMKINAHGTKS